MRDPFAGYDAWLERPMLDMIEEGDRFVDWCEEHNIAPDDPEAETMYNDYIDSQWEPEYDYDYDEGDYDYDDRELV